MDIETFRKIRKAETEKIKKEMDFLIARLSPLKMMGEEKEALISMIQDDAFLHVRERLK